MERLAYVNEDTLQLYCAEKLADLALPGLRDLLDDLLLAFRPVHEGNDLSPQLDPGGTALEELVGLQAIVLSRSVWNARNWQ